MKYWSAIANSISPYVPGEQPGQGFIKLNTNENPYPPSRSVLEAIESAAGKLNLYPSPDSDSLTKAIADCHGLSSDQVFAGNGSDEVLSFAFLAFFDSDKIIAFPDVTYSFYPVFANLFSIPFKEIPVRDDFSINPESLTGCGVIFPNPNAPTSLYMPLDAVETILKNNLDSVVIVDEAYIEFAGESSVSLIGRYPNLLVVKTFSKSHSLAGLRVGYALGDKHLIEGLKRIKNSFNSYPLDRLAQSAAEAAIRQGEYNREICDRITETREYTVTALRQLGFTLPDPSGNFVFVTHPDIKAAELFLNLRQRGILVRHFKSHRIDNYLRITIGTPDDMTALIDAVKNILKVE